MHGASWHTESARAASEVLHAIGYVKFIPNFLGSTVRVPRLLNMGDPRAVDVCKRFWISPLPYLSIIAIVSI